MAVLRDDSKQIGESGRYKNSAKPVVIVRTQYGGVRENFWTQKDHKTFRSLRLKTDPTPIIAQPN
jgi:hypothetical protein